LLRHLCGLVAKRARRVFFGKCAIVRFRRAAFAAFRMFLRAVFERFKDSLVQAPPMVQKG
jgi:hypothetical protein